MNFNGPWKGKWGGVSTDRANTQNLDAQIPTQLLPNSETETYGNRPKVCRILHPKVENGLEENLHIIPATTYQSLGS